MSLNFSKEKCASLNFSKEKCADFPSKSDKKTGNSAHRDPRRIEVFYCFDGRFGGFEFGKFQVWWV
jgi:hypothetical protein